MQEKVIPTLVESDIDYLRLTIPDADEDSLSWRDTFNAFAAREAQEGEPEVNYQMAYFRMLGHGNVSTGYHNKRWMLNASGPIAHEIMEVTKNRRFRGNCSRIDTKVSALYRLEEARRTAREITVNHWQSSEKRGQGKTHLCLYDANGEGDTVYLGKRSLASFARIYQADVRHPERYEPGTLSFEVQHNKKTASTAFNMLRSSANLHTCAGSMVVGKLLSVGVNEPWARQMPPNKVMSKKVMPEKEKTLKWVKQGVRGAFARACREGWALDFLGALGFGNLNGEQALQIIQVLEAQNSGLTVWMEES